MLLLIKIPRDRFDQTVITSLKKTEGLALRKDFQTP